MMQSRTHNCGALRIANVGEKVTLVGWMENVRVVGANFAFVVLRDFYLLILKLHLLPNMILFLFLQVLVYFLF